MSDVYFDTLCASSTDPVDRGLVIRTIAPSLVCFTTPFDRFCLLPLGARTNLLILRGAKTPGIFVTPSHHLTAATRQAISQIERETGLEMKWLVTPSGDHGSYIDQWVSAYPEAMAIGTPRWGKEKPYIKWAGIFGGESMTQSAFGFEPEVSIHLVFSHKNQELAIIHHVSKSLLTADLILNLPGTVQYSRGPGMPFLARLFDLPSKLNPAGSLHGTVVRGNLIQGIRLTRELEPIFAEDFDRIVPCHGDIIEKGGKLIFERVYGSYA